MKREYFILLTNGEIACQGMAEDAADFVDQVCLQQVKMLPRRLGANPRKSKNAIHAIHAIHAIAAAAERGVRVRVVKTGESVTVRKLGINAPAKAIFPGEETHG